jgi:hypothetical protein
MRRLLALCAALVMVVALASSSLAAVPTSKVDRFVGSFDLVKGYAWAGGTPTLLNGHVVVNFTATDGKLVPGSLDVYMPSGSAVRRSHAELTWADFAEDDYTTGETGSDETGSVHAIEAWAHGSWCDYRGPQDVSCRSFIIVFQQITTLGVADPHRVGVAFDTLEWPAGIEADWYMAGTNGAWALTYGGPTQ